MRKKQNLLHELKLINVLIRRHLPAISIVDKKMTMMHGFIIDYIYEESKKHDVFQRDIEREFGVRRSSVTSLIQLMEKNGLIKREPVFGDGRLKKLTLTEKSHVIYNVIEKRINEMEDKLKFGISNEELSSFFITLEKLKQNLGGSDD